jgi:hypothetical protein
MRQAMNNLRQFSEKEKNYFAYQARQDFIRQQNTIQFEYESALQELQEERVKKEVALAEKEAALLELANLKSLLANM